MPADDDDAVYLWTASTDGSGRRTVRTTSLGEARRMAARKRKQNESRFRRAPFPLYGLPASWDGARFLGGASWGSSLGRETIHELSLVHGVLVQGEGPMLVVECAAQDASPGGGGLRLLAEEVWSGRAENLEDAIESFPERWGEPFDEPIPTSRTLAVVPVDGTPVAFDVVSSPGRWVGRAAVGDSAVTVESDGFGVDAIELVRITDLDPYIKGSRAFHQSADPG